MCTPEIGPLMLEPGIRECQALWRVRNSFMRTGWWIWFEYFLPGSHIIAAVDSHLCHQYLLQTFLSESTAFLEYYTEVETWCLLVWGSEPYGVTILANNARLLVAPYCSVKDTWEWFPNDPQVEGAVLQTVHHELLGMVRSADHPFLGLTLLERVDQQSNTNKLQEGKLAAPMKVCNPGKIGEDQGIWSCPFQWWV